MSSSATLWDMDVFMLLININAYQDFILGSKGSVLISSETR